MISMFDKSIQNVSSHSSPSNLDLDSGITGTGSFFVCLVFFFFFLIWLNRHIPHSTGTLFSSHYLLFLSLHLWSLYPTQIFHSDLPTSLLPSCLVLFTSTSSFEIVLKTRIIFQTKGLTTSKIHPLNKYKLSSGRFLSVAV